MSRPLRIEFPGAHYHVMSRGNARQRVFLSDADLHAYLDLLGECCVRFDWHCHAFCLMPNHVHLLIETRDPNLSRGMRHLNGVFTQRYNDRHARVGHLFQGRFKAPLVDHDSYLLGLVRYILLNPVRAQLVRNAADWRWSSYAWATARRAAPAWASPVAIWCALGANEGTAARRVDAFIEARPQTDEPDWEAADVVGSNRFKASLSASLVPHRQHRELRSRARFVDRPGLAALLATHARNEAIAVAVLRWGYAQIELAQHLGLSKTTISDIVRVQRDRIPET